jgi:hypothetical protein
VEQEAVEAVEADQRAEETALNSLDANSLLTDWIKPGERTLAYAFYALGVQFGQPLQSYNQDLIEFFGW